MENEIQPNITPIQLLPQTPTPVSPTTNWKKIVLFILLGLVAIAGSTLIGIQIYKNKISKQQPFVIEPTVLPTQIVITSSVWRISEDQLNKNSSISDKYIISQVGENRFQIEYKLLPEKSLADPQQNNEKLSIAYEYLPASQLSGEQIIVYANIKNSEFQYMNGIINCLKQPERCDLKIGKNQAIEIAKNKGFITDSNYSIDLSFPDLQKNWTWKVTKKNPIQPKDPSCGSLLFIEIDLVNADVSPVKNDGWCE